MQSKIQKKIRNRSGVPMNRTLSYFFGLLLIILVASFTSCSSTGKGDVDTPAASTVHAH